MRNRFYKSSTIKICIISIFIIVMVTSFSFSETSATESETSTTENDNCNDSISLILSVLNSSSLTAVENEAIDKADINADNKLDFLDALACMNNFDLVSKSRGFQTISDELWDEQAVRKVLHTFAYGGFATDEQIRIWASLSPENAIEEILKFDIVNQKLSPVESGYSFGEMPATLKNLSAFWSSISIDNPIAEDSREDYGIYSWASPAKIWLTAVRKRGLNPVRQKIGVWETNYHMSVNQNAGVNNSQMLRYYDDIMNALAQNQAYEDVLYIGAKSAAVATQYNHKDNEFVDSKFSGNEDFAREFHQLFFGILGDYDLEYHEFTTIRNTAKLLTDMNVNRIELPSGDSEYANEVEFGKKYHYPGDLEILNTTITGETANEKLAVLSKIAIAHPESLDNLPIIIIRGLADDNLDEDKIKTIQTTWKNMETKDLLLFLRKYAISTIFHDESRIKYWSSIDRNMIVTNLVTLNNQESYLNLYDPQWDIYKESVSIFRPNHDVFGGQTGLEAHQTGDVFKEAYNKAVDRYWSLSKTGKEDENKAIIWEKDWGKIIPADSAGKFRIKSVSEWLWNRFIADGLKNFGTLERAHVYALVGSGKDLAYFINQNSPMQIYTKEILDTDPTVKEIINDLAMSFVCMNLSDVCDTKNKETANFRIGMAINFISATPYMFAQEGR